MYVAKLVENLRLIAHRMSIISSGGKVLRLPTNLPKKNTTRGNTRKKLSDSQAIASLELGEVDSVEQAEYLSPFFWRIVDRSVEDDDQDVDSLHVESSEFWNEKLMYSIAGYLDRAGYDEVWEGVSDER